MPEIDLVAVSAKLVEQGSRAGFTSGFLLVFQEMDDTRKKQANHPQSTLVEMVRLPVDQ